MKNTRFIVIAFLLVLFGSGCTYVKKSLTNAGNGLVDPRFNGSWSISAKSSDGKPRPMRSQKVAMKGRHLSVMPIANANEDPKSVGPDQTGYLAQGASGNYLCLDHCSPVDDTVYLVLRYEFQGNDKITLWTTTRAAVAAGRSQSKLKSLPGEASAPLVLEATPKTVVTWLDSLTPADWEATIEARRIAP